MEAIRLTRAQQRVLDVIQDAMRQDGRPPTRAEIADRLGFRSVNAAESHLRALERRGAIRLQGGASRGIQCLIAPDDQPVEETGLPVIGKVAAGAPIDSVAHVEKTVPVQAELFPHTPDYLLRVQGDSMMGVGILDGDLLAVSKSNTAQSGDVVVARLEGDVTVKRLETAGNQCRLIAENPAYAPIEVGPGDDFFIEGHAVGVIRTNL
jgi:repressor LexA